MPGTHRTPSDVDGGFLDLTAIKSDGSLYVTVRRAGRVSGTDVPPDALPALVAALAAHLTVDARRALTRDLATQDGEVVLDLSYSDLRAGLAYFGSLADGFPDVMRLRAAVEAARPTPTQGGDRG